ncbi:MAG: CapA family protein [Eubacteriales bacterium]
MKKIILGLLIVILGCSACGTKEEVLVQVVEEIEEESLEVVEAAVMKEIDYSALIEEMELNGIEHAFLYWVYEMYPDEFVDFYEASVENYGDELWHDCFGQSYIVLLDQYHGNNESIIKDGNTISFVGDISFADNYMGGQAYDEREEGTLGLFSSEVLDYFENSSLVVANAEFAVGEGGTPIEGKAYTFLGGADKAAIFNEINIELVTLANNHIYDYGAEVFSQTLAIYEELGIQTIGAGENIEEASKASYYVINGYKFAFVNANRSEKYILTPEATEDSPGVVRCYDPEYFISMIEAEDEKADYVVAMIHWGTEYSDVIEDVMLETSHYYIDAGADVIIGHHAHVLQGIEYYDGKPIFYNLGNFLFNEKTLDTGCVTLEVDDEGILNYTFLGALQQDVYTDFIYGESLQLLFDKINSCSINAYIDGDGNVLPDKDNS